MSTPVRNSSPTEIALNLLLNVEQKADIYPPLLHPITPTLSLSTIPFSTSSSTPDITSS